MAAERRLSAVMFTDIVGYTALMAESESRGRHARQRHREVVRPLVEAHGGEWIEAPGDESLSTFPSALEAVRCALEVQAVLRADLELRLRIGIHSGDVVFESEEIHGDGVNVAARIRPLAEPGGICVSGEVYHSVRNQPEMEAHPLGEQTLKNVSRPIEVWAIGTDGALPQRTPTWLQRFLRADLVLLAIAVFGLALFAWYQLAQYLTTASQAGSIRSIAVLPLENLSGDPEQEYFADGMTEALIGDLAKIGELRVISRTSVMQYKRQRKPLPEIAEELGVEGVLEGTVSHEGDRVRVTVQLIDARDDTHLWAERYDRDLSSVLVLQSELARTVAEQVRIELTDEERAGLAAAPSVDPRAVDAYLRGLQLERSDETLEAVAALERAVELDPEFAEGYSRLAAAHLRVGSQFLRPAEERAGAFPAAVAAASRALELDERLGMAHSTIGVVRLFQWDFAGAERALERAVRLSPSQPEVLGGYSWYLSMVGRHEEARRVAERLRFVAPLDALHRVVVARIFFYTRDYARSLEEYQRVLEMEPTWAPLHLHFVYTELGRTQDSHEARLALRRAYARFLPNYEQLLRAEELGWDEGGPEGAERASLEVMADLAARGSYSPFAVAINHAHLGEIAQAFAWLERAYEAREGVLHSLAAHPFFDSLRSDPRYDDLLRRIGFPES